MFKRLLHSTVSSGVHTAGRIMGLAFLALVAGFALFMWGIAHPHPYEGQAEAIVVMTGGEGRVETGFQLLAKGRAKYLLISGVHTRVTAEELLHMNGFDQNLAERITLGRAAQNTLGNADETLEWVVRHKVQSLIVVTANYHMPRTLLHLGAQLPDVALYPYPVVPRLFQTGDWYKHWTPWRQILADYCKLILTYPQILFMKRF